MLSKSDSRKIERLQERGLRATYKDRYVWPRSGTVAWQTSTGPVLNGPINTASWLGYNRCLYRPFVFSGRRPEMSVTFLSHPGASCDLPPGDKAEDGRYLTFQAGEQLLSSLTLTALWCARIISGVLVNKSNKSNPNENVSIAWILTGLLYTDAKYMIIKTSNILDMSVVVLEDAKNYKECISSE